MKLKMVQKGKAAAKSLEDLTGRSVKAYANLADMAELK